MPFPDPSHVSFLWCDRYGDAADCRSGFANRIKGAITVFNGSVSPITSILGLALPVAPFQAPIDASRSISHFWFEVNDGSNPATVYNNNGTMYSVLQDQIIHPSALTKDLNPSSGGANKTFFIAAAVSVQPRKIRRLELTIVFSLRFGQTSSRLAFTVMCLTIPTTTSQWVQ